MSGESATGPALSGMDFLPQEAPGAEASRGSGFSRDEWAAMPPSPDRSLASALCQVKATLRGEWGSVIMVD